MKRTIIALALMATSTLASAAGAYDNNNSAEYSGNMYNSNAMSNVQVNNSGSSYSSLGNITCPTGTFTIGAAYNDTQIESGSNASSGTSLLTYNHPIDLNGTISRCIDAQKAEVTRMETENDFNVIRNCIAAKQANLTLDPKVFPWAKKCEGIL